MECGGGGELDELKAPCPPKGELRDFFFKKKSF